MIFLDLLSTASQAVISPVAVFLGISSDENPAVRSHKRMHALGKTKPKY